APAREDVCGGAVEVGFRGGARSSEGWGSASLQAGCPQRADLAPIVDGAQRRMDGPPGADQPARRLIRAAVQPSPFRPSVARSAESSPAATRWISSGNLVSVQAEVFCGARRLPRSQAAWPGSAASVAKARWSGIT